MSARRGLPLAPLLRLEHCNRTELGRRLGRDRRTVQRWSAEGMPCYAAEEVAHALQWHPVEVWGDSYLRLSLSMERKKRRPSVYEPDPRCDHIWWWRDVVAERRRVLAESWAA